jgi:integrase
MTSRREWSAVGVRESGRQPVTRSGARRPALSTGSTVRLLFLGSRCQEILSRHILKAGSAGRVFSLTLSGFRTAITRGACKAGVDHWTPNQLRHSHATIVRKQFGVEGAQVMLGHSHINTTEIYAEASAERGKEVARKLG